AEAATPASFPNNGWVVAALQAAWSAVSTTPVPVDDPDAGVFRADHLRLALDAAVRCGRDTDTVAAIAGGLLGAAYGASAVAAEAARLAGDHGARSGGVGVGDQARREARSVRLLLSGFGCRPLRAPPARRGCGARRDRGAAQAAARRRRGGVAVPGGRRRRA